MTEKVYDKVIQIISDVLLVIFSLIIVGSIFIKAMYMYDDSPAFLSNNWYDYILLLLILIGFFGIWKCRNTINKIPAVIVVAAYAIVGLIFIWTVPLKTFSDMDQVYNAALAVSQRNFGYFSNSSYFSMYPNNIFISFLYGLLFVIFPKTVITLKVLNIFIIAGIVIISERITQIYLPNKYRNLFYILGFGFLPGFLYINHIYTDLPFVLLTIWALWLYLKNSRNILWTFILLAFSYLLRPQAVFYAIAIILHYCTRNVSIRKIIRAVVSVFIMIGAVASFHVLVSASITHGEAKSIPVWSYIYMAFNEKEFGFQDGSHRPDRTFDDVKERLAEYGPQRTAEIIGKKVFWLWSEGTYQASRYAFGEDTADSLQKNMYRTVVTEHTFLSTQKTRTFLNAFMRAQYLIQFIILLPMFSRKYRKQFSIFVLLFSANFAFYIFWEIKSRYLLPLYPLMLIFDFVFMLHFVQRLKRDKGFIFKLANIKGKSLRFK